MPGLTGEVCADSDVQINRSRQPREVAEVLVAWRPCSAKYIALEILGDNELVIGWLNGTVAVKRQLCSRRVGNLTSKLARCWMSGCIVPRT
eukprot:3785874-Karenia_brevis.AAC.1